MFYVPEKPCKKGHFKKYIANRACVQCQADLKARVKKENPIHAKNQKFKHSLKANYGLSVEEYDRLFKEQNGVCAICKKPETAKFKDKIKKLAVDHCNNTSKVRGLLCLNCNMGIGKLMHDPKLLREAALYCEKA
jgi:hypothetical protein